ncbi:MAG: hypothetical protein GXY48_15340 [Methanomicrobiales archaeon]|nr:hypothetical protein [Methanomicrobiales archaeon]
MHISYQKILPVLLFFSLLIGTVSAGSSVGSSPGLITHPTFFSWHGDDILNSDSDDDIFDESLILQSDSSKGAGMVMHNTGIAVNNTTMANQSILSNQSQVNSTQSNNLMSGYSSVGEMVKAQDWAALQRYTSGIKATEEIPDSLLSLENSNNNWEKYFKEPEVISCSPC